MLCTPSFIVNLKAFGTKDLDDPLREEKKEFLKSGLAMASFPWCLDTLPSSSWAPSLNTDTQRGYQDITMGMEVHEA